MTSETASPANPVLFEKRVVEISADRKPGPPSYGSFSRVGSCTQDQRARAGISGCGGDRAQFEGHGWLANHASQGGCRVLCVLCCPLLPRRAHCPAHHVAAPPANGSATSPSRQPARASCCGGAHAWTWPGRRRCGRRSSRCCRLAFSARAASACRHGPTAAGFWARLGCELGLLLLLVGLSRHPSWAGHHWGVISASAHHFVISVTAILVRSRVEVPYLSVNRYLVPKL